MRKGITIGILLCLASFGAAAQGTVNALETDFGARLSASAEKKIAKGLHVSVDGEVRMNDNLGSFGRYQAGSSISYRINKTFKVGAGYLFIEKKNSSSEWKPRHRFYADGAATLRSGDWRFSVKERLQLTHRDVGNPYQKTRNPLELKSRLKAAYRGLSTLTPYGYVELRNILNGPSCNATWSASTMDYSDFSFDGYTDAYINRVRTSLGAEWKVSKQHSFDFFLLADYCYEKNIDTNAKGTKLKSLTYDQALNAGIGIGYQFSF